MCACKYFLVAKPSRSIPKIHRQVYKGLIVKKNSIGEGKAALTDNLLGADTQDAHNPLMTKKSRNQ
jgi:hypothetical protein